MFFARISHKIPILVVISALICGVIVGVISYSMARNTIYKEVEVRFLALMAAKKEALANYLESIEEDIRVFRTSHDVRFAIKDFTSAWNELGPDAGKILQDKYITNNPYSFEEKNLLDSVNDDSQYDKIHSFLHPWFRQLQRERGYHDIMLFDDKGNVIYTVFKEPDFATNVITGPWKDTDVAKVYRQIMSGERRMLAVSDFKRHGASRNKPASFIATPIKSEGKIIGVMVFQMPIDRINHIMNEGSGMGESGEIYMVGKDYYMHSDSRFSRESTILRTLVKTKQAEYAIDGKRGALIGKDYRDREVFAVYRPFSYFGLESALIGEISIDEISAPIRDMRQTMIYSISIIIIIVAFIGLLLSVNITRPLIRTVDIIRKIEKKKKNFKIKYLNRNDEIGEIARALLSLVDTTNKADELAKSIKEQEQKQRLLDQKRMKELDDARKEAERQGRAKTEFLANMSHELRTPMHAILSFSKFSLEDMEDAKKLMGDKGDEIYDEITDNLKGIRNSGQRLLSLLNDLLDLSKFESGKTQLNITPARLLDVAENITKELSSLITKKEIEMIIDSGNIDTSLQCDADKLAQVVANLLSNAIKFTDIGKKIIIKIQESKLDDDVDALSLSVIDEGLGIPDGELSTIFDKFIQSSKTKDGSGGTGLGLAICKEIIMLHGGKIWAENNDEKGARFVFVIPRIVKENNSE